VDVGCLAVGDPPATWEAEVKLLGGVLLLILVLLLAFALLNWAAFTTPATLSVGVTNVQVPVGLMMLAASGLLTALFVGFILYQQAAALVAARQAARNLERQRALAEQAEASRIADLRSYLETAVSKLTNGAPGDAALGRLESQLIGRLGEVENALAAQMAEVEDKIDRVLKPIPR
jgi:uncharacterized integral membrane protein